MPAVSCVTLVCASCDAGHSTGHLSRVLVWCRHNRSEQGLREEVQQVIRQQHWPLGFMPTASQLQAAGQHRLVAAIRYCFFYLYYTPYITSPAAPGGLDPGGVLTCALFTLRMQASSL